MAHGGSRANSGRKKGSGTTNHVTRLVEDKIQEMVSDLLSDEKVKAQLKKEYSQLSTFQGWVYIIRNRENNLFKIGITQRNNPKTRLSLYLTHFMDIEVVYLDKVEHCNEVEEDLKSIVVEFKKGDWFECSLELLTLLLKTCTKNKHSKYV